MKRIHMLFSCLLIILGIAQLSAMKRDNSQITTSEVGPTIIQAPWLPGELITKIAANCNSETRTNLSSISKWFNTCASIKNNPIIMDQPEFEIGKDNRLYYLFYGCIHNLKNLVLNALQKFDPEYQYDVHALNYAKHFISQLIHNDTIKLLSNPSEVTIDREKTALLWAIDEGHNTSLIKLLLQQPTIDVNAHYIYSKETPLHRAIRNYNVEAVKLLLSCHTIDLMLCNYDKYTALDLARSIQQDLANKYSKCAYKERISRSWITKINEHNKRIRKNTDIIKLLMDAHGW